MGLGEEGSGWEEEGMGVNGRGGEGEGKGRGGEGGGGCQTLISILKKSWRSRLIQASTKINFKKDPFDSSAKK